MKLFSPRRTPTQNLTFIALMAAFDAILCLISTLLPFSAILLVILVAMISSSCAIFCQARYIAIYIFGAIGVSLAVCAYSLATAILYLVPALLSGVAYGYMWKLKLPTGVNIFIVALINLGLFYAIVYLMMVLFDGINLIDFLLTIIGRGGDEKAIVVVPMFSFLYGLAQIVIVHIFTTFQLRRLGVEEAPPVKYNWLYPCFGIASLGLSLGLSFVSLPVAYALFGIGIYWSVQSYVLLSPNISPLTVAELIFSLIVGVIVFAALNKVFPELSSLLILGIPLALADIGVILNPFFFKKVPFRQRKD